MGCMFKVMRQEAHAATCTFSRGTLELPSLPEFLAWLPRKRAHKFVPFTVRALQDHATRSAQSLLDKDPFFCFEQELCSNVCVPQCVGCAVGHTSSRVPSMASLLMPCEGLGLRLHADSTANQNGDPGHSLLLSTI